MNNNAGTARFLMLTLVFTAVFMHLFGVELLQWQFSHSSLYAYSLALGVTSQSGAEGINTAPNTALYIVTCLAAGGVAAWVVGLCVSCCGYGLHKLQLSQHVKQGHRTSNTKLDVVCGKGDDRWDI